MDVHIENITVNLNGGDDDDLRDRIDTLVADMNEWMADIHLRLRTNEPSSSLSRARIRPDEHLDPRELMVDMNRTGGYLNVKGRRCEWETTEFYIASGLPKDDERFPDAIVIAMANYNRPRIVQFWSIEDCKQLVNMLTTQIAEAEARRNGRETHQDGR